MCKSNWFHGPQILHWKKMKIRTTTVEAPKHNVLPPGNLTNILFISYCFSWMTPNQYIKNGRFTSIHHHHHHHHRSSETCIMLPKLSSFQIAAPGTCKTAPNTSRKWRLVRTWRCSLCVCVCVCLFFRGGTGLKVELETQCWQTKNLIKVSQKQ